MPLPVRVLCFLLATAATIDVSEWYGRSIYFVVTDRFARTDSGSDEDVACDGKAHWCGGTLRGVQRKLDYIQGMGFDAIWITPVVKQVEWMDDYNGTAYHGYWAKDFMQIDPHLGTADDLIALKESCHQRGMLLMVDVVANHVGPIDHVERVGELAPPLNSLSCDQFHQLGREPGETMAEYVRNPLKMYDAGNCWPYYNLGDGSCNYTKLLDGWFGDLPDLNQENPDIRKYLLNWIEYMAVHYGIDGFRLDTALYMPKDFLKAFQEAAGVYMIGEVVTYNFTLHQSFSSSLTGLLNFPITEHIKAAFNTSGSLSSYSELLATQASEGYPDLHLLGNFVDNHDNDRFLYSLEGNVLQLQNALTWSLLHHGIPIIYYGTEQFEVSNVGDPRTSMWPHFGRSDMYEFLKGLNELRQQYGLAAHGDHVRELAWPVASADNFLAFTRGALLVVVTNIGVERSVRAGLPLSAFRGMWSQVCDAAHAKAIFGAAPDPECHTEELFVTLEAGTPAVFAISNEVLV